MWNFVVSFAIKIHGGSETQSTPSPSAEKVGVGIGP